MTLSYSRYLERTFHERHQRRTQTVYSILETAHKAALEASFVVCWSHVGCMRFAGNDLSDPLVDFSPAMLLSHRHSWPALKQRDRVRVL